jgi:tetratricopeptide (TPR) repeat protein
MTFWACFTSVPALAPAQAVVEPAVARGDAAYARRAEGLADGRARPDAIGEAIAAYEEALGLDPARLDVRWRLLRALYYRGDFADVSPAERRASFERGRRLSEETIDVLAARLDGTPPHALDADTRAARLERARLGASDVARAYFWAAVHWGAWSRDAGLLTAVRAGAAHHVHDYAELSAALEPAYERGGALRLLARLHAKLPRVPFVSAWVDRDRAIPEAERALAIAPDDPGNQLLLALTLLELAPERRDEARALLARVAGAPLRPELLAEDLAVRREAEKRLAAEVGSAAGAAGAAAAGARAPAPTSG